MSGSRLLYLWMLGIALLFVSLPFLYRFGGISLIMLVIGVAALVMMLLGNRFPEAMRSADPLFAAGLRRPEDYQGKGYEIRVWFWTFAIIAWCVYWGLNLIAGSSPWG